MSVHIMMNQEAARTHKETGDHKAPLPKQPVPFSLTSPPKGSPTFRNSITYGVQSIQAHEPVGDSPHSRLTVILCSP